MSLSKNGRSIVGVMGLGVVGDAVYQYFESRGYAMRGFDPYRRIGSDESINESEIVFVCVPTPYRPGAGFDASALEDAVSRLTGSKVIVIKSTVLPGTTEAYQHRYSQHCFLFNPEFLREATAREDFLNADRQIVGYTAQSRHLAESVLSILPRAPYERVLLAREAELAKYMTNCFLALKVSFANEMYDLATALDINYSTVADAVAADPRIGGSHLDVFAGGYRGYGGNCLPKDTKALIDLGDRLGVPLRMMRTADRVNTSLLPPADEPMAQRPLPIPLHRLQQQAAELDERAA